MSNRRIQDERGVQWDIWDVRPSDVLAGSYDRRSGERLRAPSPHSTASVIPELENGWLCFQSAGERRRFAPIPADWYDLTDDSLRALLETASPVAASTEAPPKRLPAE